MTQKSIQIQNLKCAGCAKTIETQLNNISGLSELQIDIENSLVSFSTDSHNTEENILELLKKLGYPAEGTSNSLINKATSYVSCAIGKIS